MSKLKYSEELEELINSEVLKRLELKDLVNRKTTLKREIDARMNELGDIDSQLAERESTGSSFLEIFSETNPAVDFVNKVIEERVAKNN